MSDDKYINMDESTRRSTPPFGLQNHFYSTVHDLYSAAVKTATSANVDFDEITREVTKTDPAAKADENIDISFIFKLATVEVYRIKYVNYPCDFNMEVSGSGGGGVSSVPRIVNFDYDTANAIESIALTANTFKVLLKHRDKGLLEFSYDSGLATYVTLSKGSSYADEDFLLNGRTLYFRSPTIGTVELLEYSLV